jgi:hypothetical protein
MSHSKKFWYIASFITGWSVLNVILNIMRKQPETLYMISIPSLLASLGWLYSEYKRVFKEE